MALTKKGRIVIRYIDPANWLNAPVAEFVAIPWDRVKMGCHVLPDKTVKCWDYMTTSALYKSVDPPVTIHGANAFDPLPIYIALIISLLIYFAYRRNWI